MRSAVQLLLLLAAGSGAALAEWFDLSEEFNLTTTGRRRLADDMNNPPHRFICWFRNDVPQTDSNPPPTHQPQVRAPRLPERGYAGHHISSTHSPSPLPSLSSPCLRSSASMTTR